MTISFAGHSFVPFVDEVKEKVKEEMRKSIDGAELVTCYLGGYGSFDALCARACKEIKKEHEGIEIVYVAPYIGDTRLEEIERSGLYDATVYPPIENTPPRLAIIKRNEWMMEKADIVIAYVKYERGGAYRTLLAARKKKRRIINICGLL